MYSNEFIGGMTNPNPALTELENVREITPGAMGRTPVRNPGRLRAMRKLGSDAGMATAEYAIATLAAVGFAGLLVVILKSEEVRGFLMNIIRSALSF